MSGCISSDSRDAEATIGRTVELPADDFSALVAILAAPAAEERLHLVFDWQSAPAPTPEQWQALARQDACTSPARRGRLEGRCRRLAEAWPPRLSGLHRIDVDGDGGDIHGGRLLLSVLQQWPAPARRRWQSDFRPPREGTVLIIGAGLAGCALADALLRRGFLVEVLEAGDQVGGAVIGLPWLAQHPALSPDRRARLLWQAVLTSQRLTPRLAPAFVGCGRWQPLATALHDRRLAGLPDALARPVAAGTSLPAAGSDMPAVTAPADGIWLPACQAADPAAWWRQLHRRAGLRLRTGAAVASLVRDTAANAWQARDTAGQPIASAATVVLANAADAFRLAGLPPLASGPLRDLPHQVWIGSGDGVRQAGRPRLLPVLGGQRGARGFLIEEPAVHCVLGDDEPAARHYRWHRSAPRNRLRLRDNLPMAGPVPDMPAILTGRDRFERDARLALPARPDLFLLAGLGGRGLLWSIIGAELIAAAINGEPAPLEPELSEAIAPDRFIVRSFRRAPRGRAALPASATRRAGSAIE